VIWESRAREKSAKVALVRSLRAFTTRRRTGRGPDRRAVRRRQRHTRLPLQRPSSPRGNTMAAATVGQECRTFRIVSSSSRRTSGERVESWPSSFSRTSHFSSAWRAFPLTAVSAVWVVGDLSENPQSSRAVASGQSGIVIFVIHCLPLSSARSSIARWNF
jgi:hypothetical protein